MIPKILKREFGFNSFIMGIENPLLKASTNSDIEKIIGKRKLLTKIYEHLYRIVVKKKKNTNKNGLRALCYVIDNFGLFNQIFRYADVLHLMHFTTESLFLSFLYKIFNPKGIIYIKTDMDSDFLHDTISQPDNLLELRKWFLSIKLFKIDILSVENKRVLNYIKKRMPNYKKYATIIYIPNGSDYKKESNKIVPYSEKENLILYAARIGSYQKATEIIIEAFLEIASDFPDWKLILMGRIQKDFLGYFNKRVRKSELFNKQIFYLGFVYSRDKVIDYHSRAKIFALPSRYEGFSNASLDAAIFGDVIIGSNISSLRVLTNKGKLGILCPIGDLKYFTEKLRYLLSHDDELKTKSEELKKFSKDNFDWTNICKRLNRSILKKIQEKM